MGTFLRWWKNGLPPWVKFVYLVLLANGLPAFFILASIPGQTQDWFVWTIRPDASARLLAVMYGNALLLVGLGFAQRDWAHARITLVVITFFSVAATIVTFFNLTPFLQHPWYHLTYWLTMYLILFVAAPLVFYFYERREGGRLPVLVPLSPQARVAGVLGALLCGLTGLGLFINPALVNDYWPWNLTPLVARILAVWFTALALAYLWALWDGDWTRTRLIFWQALPTSAGLALLPLLHRGDVRPGAEFALSLYLGTAAGVFLITAFALLTARRAGAERRISFSKTGE